MLVLDFIATHVAAFVLAVLAITAVVLWRDLKE